MLSMKAGMSRSSGANIWTNSYWPFGFVSRKTVRPSGVTVKSKAA